MKKSSFFEGFSSFFEGFISFFAGFISFLILFLTIRYYEITIFALLNSFCIIVGFITFCFYIVAILLLFIWEIKIIMKFRLTKEGCGVIAKIFTIIINFFYEGEEKDSVLERWMPIKF